MHNGSGTFYEFGLFRLDAERRILLRNDVPVPLEPKVCETLLVLVENRGCVVSKDDLLKRVWHGAVVEEGGLARNISILRKALGERPDDHQYVVTLPGRGYQFVAKVQVGRENGAHAPLSKAAPAVGPDVPSKATSATPAVFTRLQRIPFAAVLVSGFFLLALLGSWSWWRAQRSAGSVSSSNLIRLTATSGLNAGPALTRDGSFVAYVSDRGAMHNLDIWVQPVGGGDPIQRTSADTDETEPSFSPDNSQIVFSRRDAGIYVMGTLSGEPQLVAPVAWGRTPRFSPDGKWIAFWTGFPPSVVSGGIPQALGNIHVVPAGGGKARLIPIPLASARYPVWSPEGEHLLFLGEENPDLKTHDWYVIPKDGGRPVKTGAVDALRAQGLGNGIPIPGAWTPHDNAVVLATNEAESSNIWRISVSPSNGRLAGPPVRLTFGSAIEREPAISDSGRIAFVSAAENVDVWRFPVDAKTGMAKGELERVTDSAASDVLRNVGDGGKSLMFLSSRTGRMEVWTRDLESGRYRQWTHRGVDDASASPDGRMLAYSRTEAGEKYIEVLAAADGQRSRFCGDCANPWDWSSGGSRLLFGKGLPARVLIHDFPAGRGGDLVRHDQWGLYMARFSPDAHWVAFHAAPSPNVRRVYAVSAKLDGPPVPAGEWVPVVSDHGCHPNWSPDGSLLYYFSFRDGHFCLYAQPVDRLTMRPTGPYREVRHFHNPRLRAASGAAAYNRVQPNHVYLSLTETQSNIWLLNDGK